MQDSDFPLVTIIIANYNYGKYLPDAIDSAIKQNYPPKRMRIYVVDDNSTDNSWEILHTKYFKKIPHEKQDLEFKSKTGVLDNGAALIAVKCPVSRGPSAARNIAINSTIDHTDVYMILDADDIYYPDKTLKFVNQIYKDKDRIGAVYADYDILNVETGNTIREFKKPFDKMVLHQECIVHSGAGINAQALKAVNEQTGYYDENMRTCEDYDLWMRISDQFMIVHVPESLSLVRVHKENATFSVPNEIWQQNWHRVQEKANARLHGK